MPWRAARASICCAASSSSTRASSAASARRRRAADAASPAGRWSPWPPSRRRAPASGAPVMVTFPATRLQAPTSISGCPGRTSCSPTSSAGRSTSSTASAPGTCRPTSTSTATGSIAAGSARTSSGACSIAACCTAPQRPIPCSQAPERRGWSCRGKVVKRFGRLYELYRKSREKIVMQGTGLGERMQDKLKDEALRESRKALDLMARSVLTATEQQAVVDDCVTNFDRYVNPGILEYRKSVSSDYTSVEWRDEGSVFYDIHGKEFIDCLGGFGIYMLGHRHPTVVKAVRDQLEHQALHSQELLDPMRGYLSHLLAMVTPGDLRYSFFCNSGTEANEGAMKLAKLWARRKKADHTLGMISTTRGFHGKSFGSLSVSGKGEFRQPFYPLMSGVRFVPYGDADALDKQLAICD